MEQDEWEDYLIDHIEEIADLFLRHRFGKDPSEFNNSYRKKWQQRMFNVLRDGNYFGLDLRSVETVKSLISVEFVTISEEE